MGISEFRQIAEGFCQQAGLPDSLSIVRGNAFSIHGRLAWLHYLPDSDQCRITLDLGQPGHGFPPAMLRMMLEFNCANQSRHLPALGISQKNGHALLMLHPSMAVLRKETSLFALLDIQLKPVIEAWVDCLDASDIDGMEAPVMLDRGFV